MPYKMCARSAVTLSLALVLAFGSLSPARAMRGFSALRGPRSVVNVGCQDWKVLSSPNVGSYSNALSGVAAITATDAWAVGSYSTTSYNSTYQTLAEHWDGSTWKVTSTPNSSSIDGLDAVAAIATNNVWAVGNWTNATTGIAQTLIEHWDGVSWKVVSSPNQSTSFNTLLGVAAVSANDIWAVGFYDVGAYYPLIEHWDGSTWSIAKTPNPSGTYNQLRSVSADSATDVWAVGLGGSSGEKPLVEHWDGSTWSIVTAPYPANQSIVVFTSVTAFSATNAWVVGGYDDGTNASSHPLIEHWNGSAWTASTLPAQALPYAGLSGVAGLPGALFAVGATSSQQSGPYTALVLEWNGAAWSVVQAPAPTADVALNAAAPQGLNVFAVGAVRASTLGQGTLAAIHHPMMGIACA